MSKQFEEEFKRRVGDNRRLPSSEDIGKRVKLTYLSATSGEPYKIITGTLKSVYPNAELVDIEYVKDGVVYDFMVGYIMSGMDWRCVYDVKEVS